MADAMSMYAMTTGFFISLVDILFGKRVRKRNYVIQ